MGRTSWRGGPSTCRRGKPTGADRPRLDRDPAPGGRDRSAIGATHENPQLPPRRCQKTSTEPHNDRPTRCRKTADPSRLRYGSAKKPARRPLTIEALSGRGHPRCQEWSPTRFRREEGSQTGVGANLDSSVGVAEETPQVLGPKDARAPVMLDHFPDPWSGRELTEFFLDLLLEIILSRGRHRIDLHRQSPNRIPYAAPSESTCRW